MPIVVSNQGWVKVPPKPVRRKKPVDPVDAFRGPLAYITGRSDFKEPVKKQSITQLLIEAAPPPPPVEPAHRSRRPKRVPSAPEILPQKSKSKSAPRDIFEEVDEEIIRPELHPEDSQSRRSASPAASRHSRAAPSVRSRRDPPRPSTIYDDGIDQDGHRSSRSRRHASHSHSHAQSVYDDEPRHPHRSERSERNYRDSYYRDRERERDRDRDRYYSSHHHNYSTPQLPTLQPIVIYSTPPAPAGGCGGHHGCHGHGTSYQQQYYQPQPVLQAAPAPAAIEAPRPPPSVVSSRSSASKRSETSYKWYTATQPLKL